MSCVSQCISSPSQLCPCSTLKLRNMETTSLPPQFEALFKLVSKVTSVATDPVTTKTFPVSWTSRMRISCLVDEGVSYYFYKLMPKYTAEVFGNSILGLIIAIYQRVACSGEVV